MKNIGKTLDLDHTQIYNDLPHAILVLKADAPVFTMMHCNPAYEAAMGRSRDELIGRPFFDVFPQHPDAPEDEGREVIARVLQQVAKNADTVNTERMRYDLCQPDGIWTEHYWNTTSAPLFNSNNEVVAVLHSPSNVTAAVLTERKAAEEHRRRQELETRVLQQQEQKDALQQMIDLAQICIFVIHPVSFGEDGRVTDFYFIRASKNLSRYQRDASIDPKGKKVSELFPKYFTNGLFDGCRHTYETGEGRQMELNYHEKGAEIWLNIQSNRLPDGDVLVTVADHTELKRLTLSMQRNVDELKRSNQYLEQFAYVASHDLQEPLRKIEAFSELLQMKYAPEMSEGASNLLNRMQNSAARMRTLIEDLLLYSRISMRPRELMPVDPGEVIDDVRADMEASIREKSAQIIAAGLRPVYGDAGQLHHLFQNLFSNSLKFVRPGVVPIVRIRGEVSGPPAGTGNSAEQERYLRLSIQDNGQGFEQQYADRIFGMFQRLHARSEAPGTGIGLSIVQKVIENHNGYIQASGVAGEGAEFTIWLPLAADVEEDATQSENL